LVVPFAYLLACAVHVPLELRTGDLFAADGIPALAHGCNCSGSMGRGIAVEFRRRWPAMYDAYRVECREGRFRPGGVFVWREPERTIFNLGSQPIPGPTARLDYIDAAVREALRIAEAESIAAVGMPRIGSGFGGLAWSDVRDVLESIAKGTDVLLAVYELAVSGDK
jgi:O-acetyl-ADP-ribose deacetylase (regulator of RNase III)